jgi:hypothetical protein
MEGFLFLKNNSFGVKYNSRFNLYISQISKENLTFLVAILHSKLLNHEN